MNETVNERNCPFSAQIQLFQCLRSCRKDWKRISGELSLMSPDDPICQGTELNWKSYFPWITFHFLEGMLSAQNLINKSGSKGDFHHEESSSTAVTEQDDDDVCFIFDPENDDFVVEFNEEDQTIFIQCLAWSFFVVVWLGFFCLLSSWLPNYCHGNSYLSHIKVCKYQKHALTHPALI